MAAIFASTASAAGLISLAVQALDSAAKVKRCYNSFKHAPQEIKDLVAELELNQELLTLLNSSTIGQGQQAQTIGQSQTLVKCTKLCDGIQKDLEGVLNPLQAQLMTNPKRGAARYVFAEGHIKEWLVKLERAKSMLVVVLAETNSYRTSTQLESIQAGVTNISTSQQAFGQQIGNLLSTSNDTTKQGRSAVDEWKAHIRASNAVFQSQSK
ncbi:hypothetical protein K431DRAFT_123049 [Polychaeton citri CBS 116435]|uniref:Azaphilone pigments biosynthesis cluster protein L N-terminal domain-containing protein n=1 Tax=Polychaeton citri CBS 116435 TaxID=1314669 RepID=A0A9P4UMM9_9PEZI|nr:hypothetical protein K431DRAFT_123049 [Polychaeton citri CBS 116435]